jgi:hypothetical protein
MTDGQPCPICGGKRDPQFRPFCSRRCSLVDLGKWLKGDYAIPGAPDPDAADEAPQVDRLSREP